MRFNPNEKPPEWGPPDQVESAVRHNAERAGMPAPKLYLPLWEAAGDNYYNYGSTPIHGYADAFGAGEGWVNTPHGVGVYMLSTSDGCIYVPEHVDFCPVANTPFTVCAWSISRGSLYVGKYKNNSPFGGEWLISHIVVQILRDAPTLRIRRTYSTAIPTGFVNYGFTWSGGQADGLIPYVDGSVRASAIDDNVSMSGYPVDQQSAVTVGAGVYEGTYESRSSETVIQVMIFKGIEASAAQISLLYEQPYFLLEPYVSPVYFDLGAAPAQSPVPLLMQQMDQFNGGTFL